MAITLARVRALLREAKRRRIYTSAVAYLAVAVGVIELSGNLLPALLDSNWTILLQRIIIVLLALGFPVVLVLAWIFDIGPQGIQRTADIGEGKAGGPRRRSNWSAALATPKAEAPRTIELVQEAPRPERVRQASLAFVRHELRTPINAIIGYGEMLLDDARDEGDDAAAADLDRVVRCGRDILSLIEAILHHDRISAEDRELASYGEQIRADLRDPLGAITGYTEMLLETSREEERDARTRDLEKILVAAHKLLELSNDIVAVATRAPGAVPTDISRSATLTAGVLSKIRAVQGDHHEADRDGALLVVDDSPTNRDLIAKQLARKGYVVATAENGKIALEKMAEQRFDLVLLDVVMPELDGIEVLRRMKSDVALCSTPVIMISALDEIDSVVRCLEIGAADFVSKPFHPTLLDARIQATIAAQRVTSAPVPLDENVERLIGGTFPDYLVERVRAGETRILDGSPNAAAFFADIDQAVAAADPRERAAKVELLITIAHEVAAEHGAAVLLHGIGLLMAAGFPQPADDAVPRIARAALAFSQRAEAHGIRCRCAIHSGALYAALVGAENLSYSVWGDAVDMARRMALSGERGHIMVSAACHGLLKDQFALSNRGVIEVAGRGQMKAYALESDAVPASSSL